MARLFISIILVIGGTISAEAYIDDGKAIRTIVGEASNQGFKGMVCIGEVIRKRGSLKGFYGARAKHVDTEPEWVWVMARQAWAISETSDYTRGAKFYENTKAFGMPYWSKGKSVALIYKEHVFFY